MITKYKISSNSPYLKKINSRSIQTKPNNITLEFCKIAQSPTLTSLKPPLSK